MIQTQPYFTIATVECFHLYDLLLLSDSMALQMQGLPVCSYYSFYGLCKYGPTCKYDHPLTGYSYNSDLNFPTLPVFYPPVFPYQRNLPTVLSLEQSPPKLASISDWVKKPEAEVNENPKLETETPESASEHAISPQLPLSDSSELSHEQSD